MDKKATVSAVLRQAIMNSDQNRDSISHATGIDRAALSRFVHRQVGLNTTSVDILADYLGLKLVPKGKKTRR